MKELTTYFEFENKVENTTWLLVYVGITPCKPCDLLFPIIEKIERDFNKILHTVFIDAEKVPEVVGKYVLKSVPTLLLFNKGEVVEGTEGTQSYNQVSRWLTQHLLVF